MNCKLEACKGEWCDKCICPYCLNLTSCLERKEHLFDPIIKCSYFKDNK